MNNTNGTDRGAFLACRNICYSPALVNTRKLSIEIYYLVINYSYHHVFRQPLLVTLVNQSQEEVQVSVGDEICELIVVPFNKVEASHVQVWNKPAFSQIESNI